MLLLPEEHHEQPHRHMGTGSKSFLAKGLQPPPAPADSHDNYRPGRRFTATVSEDVKTDLGNGKDLGFASGGWYKLDRSIDR